MVEFPDAPPDDPPADPPGDPLADPCGESADDPCDESADDPCAGESFAEPPLDALPSEDIPPVDVPSPPPDDEPPVLVAPEADELDALCSPDSALPPGEPDVPVDGLPAELPGAVPPGSAGFESFCGAGTVGSGTPTGGAPEPGAGTCPGAGGWPGRPGPGP